MFLCSCCSLLGSPDIAQETGAKLHFSIAFLIERSRNFACFCAFWLLVFEHQSIFGHNINRLSYSCGLLIAFFQIPWAIIGWKTCLVSFFSGHWNFTSDVIMAKIIGRAIACQRKRSWPLPPGPAHEKFDVWIKAVPKPKFPAELGGKNGWAVPSSNSRSRLIQTPNFSCT